jgi:O-acetyl-ADP-ribose deacetylase (regulator of RNase III)
MITYVHGNLLKAPAEALVNTVNTVGVMGKGIALQFSRAWPDMYQHYADACKAGRVRLGHMYVYDTGGLAGGPRYIINFPTKGHWKARSRLSDIASGLTDLVQLVKRLDIKSIAVPPLGCGNGGLDWTDVQPLIVQAFAALPDVEVQVFAPQAAPVAAEMPQRTDKPAMTLGRAVLIKLIERYKRALIEPFVTLLEVQKLMYFMQEAGEPLKLNFAAAKYGPYAENLRHQLNRLEGHYTTGFGDGSEAPTKMLDLRPGAVEEADDFLARADDVNKRMDRVGRLIDGFEDPFGMELLATVHWVMVQSPEAASDVAAAVRLVHDWSGRKRHSMTAKQIEVAWHQLVREDWHFDSASIGHAYSPPAPLRAIS